MLSLYEHRSQGVGIAEHFGRFQRTPSSVV